MDERKASPPGLPDSAFIRGAVPMTKSEIRAITMSKARLGPGLRVLDIGAGTGSLCVEAALLCPGGEVTAIERDPEAWPILNANVARFGLSSLVIVRGEAPGAIDGLAPFDRVFLGGSGGHLAEILDALPGWLRPGGRVVANTICLETTTEIIGRFRKAPWTDWEIVQVSVARGVPVGSRLVRFEPLSPVWIVSARLEVSS